MTSEETALFDASVVPSDRTAALVYADWLTERGRDREASYWRKVVEYRTRYASAPGDYNCTMWMLTCGELYSGFSALRNNGCPQCRNWASLNQAEEADRWLCGMADKVRGRKML